MEVTISLLTMFPLDKPTKTSAPFINSAKSAGLWSFAKICFSGFNSSLQVVIKPFESHIKRFSDCTPRLKYSLAHEMADAPAPLKTTLIVLISFSEISNAFNNAAAVIIAVPC